MSDLQQPVLRIMAAICKPLARYCLRNAIGVQQAIEALKKSFIDLAGETIEASGHTPNVSRLSIATGLQRRDVQRLISEDRNVRQAPHALSRIIAAWETQSTYTTKNGKPKVLSFEGADSEFHGLVRLITSDLHPGTVLFQLENMGVVEKTPHGARLKYAAERVQNNPEKAYQLMSQDMDDLPCAVEENIASTREIPHLHGRTEYDNILQSALPEVEQWLLKEGSLFHQKARAYLSQFDCDLHPHKKGDAGSRVALVTFSISKKPSKKTISSNGNNRNEK